MIRRKDLADTGDKDYNARQGEFMQCQDCEEVLGGTRGDFFMMAMDEAFNCPMCSSVNIALVRTETKKLL